MTIRANHMTLSDKAAPEGSRSPSRACESVAALDIPSSMRSSPACQWWSRLSHCCTIIWEHPPSPVSTLGLGLLALKSGTYWPPCLVVVRGGGGDIWTATRLLPSLAVKVQFIPLCCCCWVYAEALELDDGPPCSTSHVLSTLPTGDRLKPRNRLEVTLLPQ